MAMDLLSLTLLLMLLSNPLSVFVDLQVGAAWCMAHVAAGCIQNVAVPRNDLAGSQRDWKMEVDYRVADWFAVGQSFGLTEALVSSVLCGTS